jgi:deoxyribodipyrimidine photolyase
MTISIDSRILHLKQLYAEIQQKISTIYEYLLLQASNGRYVDHQKEQKIKFLKIQLKSLQAKLAKSKSKPLSFPKPPQIRMTSYYPDLYWAKHSPSYNLQPSPTTL